MREKKLCLIIAFSTTADAIRMEKYCQAHHLPGRIIPLPAEISASCGLAWKTDPRLQDDLESRLLEDQLSWESMRILSI